MKKIILLITILLSTRLVFADNVDFKVNVDRNDMIVSGEFWLNLQISITSGSTPKTLNGLTVDIYYGSQLTAKSTFDERADNWGPSPGNGYSCDVENNSGYYRILITGNNVGKFGFTGWDVSDSYNTVVRLKWTINTATTVNINISDATDAASYFNNYQNTPNGGVTDWVVTNQDLGDQSLPVQMGNIAATASAGEGIVLAWRTESEVNSAGFHVWRSQSENGTYKPVTTSLMPSQGNGSAATEYKFVDKNVQDEHEYWYKIEEISTDGKSEFFGPISVQGIPLPTEYSMAHNYPNPFNPETTIKYELPEVSEVSVKVYTILGKEVKTLVSRIQNAGRYTAKWNGTGEDGKRVPSGIYFIRIQAGIFSQTRKMTFMQ